jgi:hypothetical protein
MNQGAPSKLRLGGAFDVMTRRNENDQALY